MADTCTPTHVKGLGGDWYFKSCPEESKANSSSSEAAKADQPAKSEPAEKKVKCRWEKMGTYGDYYQVCNGKISAPDSEVSPSSSFFKGLMSFLSSLKAPDHNSIFWRR